MFSQYSWMKYRTLRETHIQNILKPLKIPDICEADLEEKMAMYFTRFFNVKTQVFCDNRKSKVDIIMFHKSDCKKERPFIIEIKTADKKKGAELSAWLKQSERYVNSTFDGKKAYVFTYPQISGLYLDEGILMNGHDPVEHNDHNVTTFIYAAFGIGELRKYFRNGSYYLKLVINGKWVWDSWGDKLNLNSLPW